MNDYRTRTDISGVGAYGQDPGSRTDRLSGGRRWVVDILEAVPPLFALAARSRENVTVLAVLDAELCRVASDQSVYTVRARTVLQLRVGEAAVLERRPGGPPFMAELYPGHGRGTERAQPAPDSLEPQDDIITVAPAGSNQLRGKPGETLHLELIPEAQPGPYGSAAVQRFRFSLKRLLGGSNSPWAPAGVDALQFLVVGHSADGDGIVTHRGRRFRLTGGAGLPVGTVFEAEGS